MYTFCDRDGGREYVECVVSAADAFCAAGGGCVLDTDTVVGCVEVDPSIGVTCDHIAPALAGMGEHTTIRPSEIESLSRPRPGLYV